KDIEAYRFTRSSEKGIRECITSSVTHKCPYLFLIKRESGNRFLRDPASTYFDDDGNCIFWDFDDPSGYVMEYDKPDRLHRPSIVLQTDLPGLVARWYEYDRTSPSLAERDTDLFTFIATCGVLDTIEGLGYNTIQFLPISQSIDGDNWKFRYLSPFPFALQKNWGDPDSFKLLVDECHKRGIAVISDLILGHSPFKDYRIFGFEGEDIGLHLWKHEDGRDVFLDDMTPWGTKRFRNSDYLVRQYLVESALHFLQAYRIDGFRIDNVDGILRYGDAGQGEERPHGRQFLRELISQCYEFDPLTLFHLESHYFYGDNAKLLVAPHNSFDRALGATAYNSSRLTYFFHTEFMPKAADEISIWTIKNIMDEKVWTRSDSTIADFHNHDAAAGLMEMRATGSYAYHALTLGKRSLKRHAIGKIKVMEAIIALGCEGRFLDLIQTFLLQTGTFEHDSSIEWKLLKTDEDSARTTEFKRSINELTSSQPAFWPENTLYREYVNIDEKNKIIVIKRSDKTRASDKTWYCIINLSDNELFDYRVGVSEPGSYHIGFDSTSDIPFKNSGASGTVRSQPSTQFELFSEEIVLEHIDPYQVICIYHDDS
ncbi:MAG: alpha-amylase family glycosyl hydrolase, partial [Nanoarchaeota archaeon]